MSKSERDTMGQNGRDYFEQHFERERLLDRLETMFAEVTGLPLQEAASEASPRESEAVPGRDANEFTTGDQECAA